MAILLGENVGTSYLNILNLGNAIPVGISPALEPITDGAGATSSLSVSDTKVAINSEIYIGNDGSGTWEPGIYNTTSTDVNISINPNTIVVSNDYSTGSYDPANTPSAIFEMASITQGMLLPRMGNADIPNIDRPEAGLVIYNLDVSGIQYYDGTQWMNVNATAV
jgi:hypothetical protein